MRLLILALLLSGACGDDGDSDRESYSIAFRGHVNGTEFACGDSYTLGSTDLSATVTDFRFYVTNVRIIDGSGTEHPVDLTDDDVWQTADVALLDFENAADGCDGTAGTNEVVIGTANTADPAGVVFEIGVPFSANHGLAADAEPPLNTTGMQWNWRDGYKYIRVDTNNGNGEWSMHIGANGCEGDDMMSPPGSECTNPNRPTVRLESFDPQTQAVAIDFGNAVSTTNVDTPNEPPPGCLSFEIAEAKCTGVFDRFGMGFSEGGCVNGCESQTVATAVER